MLLYEKPDSDQSNYLKVCAEDLSNLSQLEIWLPAKTFQIDAFIAKLDCLFFQHRSLHILATEFTALANFSLRVHDTMPWQRRPFRQVIQSITDLACMSWGTSQRSDLPIGHNVSMWDFGDDRENSSSGFTHGYGCRSLSLQKLDHRLPHPLTNIHIGFGITTVVTIGTASL